MRKFGLILLATGLVATGATLAHADSFVRVVRLSWVSGAVQVNLPDGNGWRPALLNAPLTEGEAVRTAGNGRAEIELEDGSTLRLIPGSEVDFAKLRLLDDGTRVTTAALASGTIFVSTRKGDSKAFQLTFPSGEAVVPNGDASFRAGLPTTDAAHAAARLEVLSGRPSVLFAGSQVKLQKSEAATLVAAQPPVVAKDTAAPDNWQQWSDNRDHWYEQGEHSGVAPADLNGYVNWYAETGALTPPSYTGAMLAQNNSAESCQWSLAGGWCWNADQGWYMASADAGTMVPGALGSPAPVFGLMAGGASAGYGGYYDPCNSLYYGNPYNSFYGNGFGGWGGMGFGGWGMGGFNAFGCSPFGYGYTGYPVAYGYPFYGYPLIGATPPPAAGGGAAKPILPIAHGPHSPLPPRKYVPVANPPIGNGAKFGEKMELASEHSVNTSAAAAPRFMSGSQRFTGTPPSTGGRLVGPPPAMSGGAESTARFHGSTSSGRDTGGFSRGVSASIGPPSSGSRFSAPTGGISTGGGGFASSAGASRVGAVSSNAGSTGVSGGSSRGAAPSGGGSIGGGSSAGAASHGSAPSGGSSSAAASSGATHH